MSAEETPVAPSGAPGAGTEGGLDDLLLERVRAGDDAAFVRLYRVLAPPLHRYAASLVGDDADDVTAEAWLQIARDVRAFPGNIEGLRGWTARIVRNRAMDLLRSRRRRPTVAVPVDELFDLPAGHDTEDAALTALGTAHAVALIATLPHDQAEAVMLRVVVGLSPAAAGDVLGKSAAAVRVASHRGLRRLERRLVRQRAGTAVGGVEGSVS